GEGRAVAPDAVPDARGRGALELRDALEEEARRAVALAVLQAGGEGRPRGRPFAGAIGGERRGEGGLQRGRVAVELALAAKQLEDALRLRLAAHLDRVDLAHLDRLGRQRRRALADQDRHVVDPGRLLDARRQVDAVADQRIGARRFRPDAADDDVAAGDADAQPDRRQSVNADDLGHGVGEFMEAHELVERRAAGTHRVVFRAGEGRAPIRHDPVADILVDDAALQAYRLAHRRQI